jgi:TatA/E family protein of Tat protein translocase
MPGFVGLPELLLLGLVALLVFGAKRVPEMGAASAKGCERRRGRRSRS